MSLQQCLGIVRKDDPGAVLHGEGEASAEVCLAAGLDDETLDGAVVFCQEKRAARRLCDGDKEVRFSLCLAPPDLVGDLAQHGPVIATANPKLGFARIAARLHGPVTSGPLATIGDGAVIHETAVIGPGATIGAGARIGPHVSIGPGVEIGEACEIGPGASVQCAILGDRVRLLAGARIGEDGFGFVEVRAPGAGGLVRVPQIGRVVLGDDVEIGANSCVDRGTLGDTRIGVGAKIDNFVQIGHNVRIGRHCVIAAHAGFSGSCVVGDGVMIGGQSGFADHVRIGDKARIAAQSGVMRDVPAGESWGGSPAREMREWLREVAMTARMAKRNRKKNDG